MDENVVGILVGIAVAVGAFVAFARGVRSRCVRGRGGGASIELVVGDVSVGSPECSAPQSTSVSGK